MPECCEAMQRDGRGMNDGNHVEAWLGMCVECFLFCSMSHEGSAPFVDCSIFQRVLVHKATSGVYQDYA